MTRVSVILALFLVVFPLGAAAPGSQESKTKTNAVVRRAAPASQESRQRAALALIDFPWQELGYEIVFLPAQPGFRAMTIGQKRRIEIYVRPGDDSRLLAYDIAHELGHAIDLTYNTATTRAKWMETRGIAPATPWFSCDRCSDYNSPAGDFAETFALLLFGPEHFKARIAPRPTAEQIPSLARFFPVIRHGSHAAN